MSVLFDGLTPVVFISPSGDDDIGTGTYENPWLTMDKAGSNTGSGDIIGVKNGTYYTIEEPTPDRVWVGESFGGVFFDDQLSTNTFYRRLTYNNLPNRYINIGWRNIDGSKGRQSVFPIESINGVYFKNCIFRYITTKGGVGLPTSGASASRGGLLGAFSDWQKNDIKCTMINCIFDDIYIDKANAWGSIFGGLYSVYNTKYKIINCIIRLIRDTPSPSTCVFSGEASNTNAYITIRNTIFSNEQSGPIRYFNHTGVIDYNLDIDNNCMYNFTLTGPNDFDQNPKFIDPDNGDFRLQTTSPCLGMGVNFDG